MGPGNVYRNPVGHSLLLFVRQEARRGVDGHLFVGTRNRVVYTYWMREGEAIPGELVNDVAGRTEATVAVMEREAVERQRDALNVVIRQAVGLLSPSQAEDLRKLYVKQLNEVK